MAEPIRATQNDAGRTVVYDLKINGAGEDLSSAVVVCHMKNVESLAVITSAAVTVDADQAANPGRVSTLFSAVELATPGFYTLEWQATIGAQVTTYPDDNLPLLMIRKEAA
jgi:hypothetical protein